MGTRSRTRFVFLFTFLQRRCCCSHLNELPVTKPTTPSPSLLEKKDPMMTLTNVFRKHPSCLRMHRELTVCIANGDGERAADLASVLAETIKRVTKQTGESTGKAAEFSPHTTQSPPEKRDVNEVNADMPVAGPDDVAFAMEKTESTLLSFGKTNTDTEAVARGTNGNFSLTELHSDHSVEQPFWKQSSAALRVTLLETAFEMSVPNSKDTDNPLSSGGLVAEEYEKKQMALLDEYLALEKRRWEAQKGAVGRVVLTTAQRLGLTPEDLYGAVEEETKMGDAAAKSARFSPLRHCNVIVRCEPPEAALLTGHANTAAAANDVLAAVEEELEVLARRMAKKGSPLSAKDREMAFFELVMTKSNMRYVVGLHRELQNALNASESFQRQAAEEKLLSGSELFSQKLLETLNRVAPDGTESSAEDVDLVEALSKPVIPFTFMLKMCLWFEI